LLKPSHIQAVPRNTPPRKRLRIILEKAVFVC
jgi:hypothetical protein